MNNIREKNVLEVDEWLILNELKLKILIWNKKFVLWFFNNGIIYIFLEKKIEIVIYFFKGCINIKINKKK